MRQGMQKCVMARGVQALKPAQCLVLPVSGLENVCQNDMSGNNAAVCTWWPPQEQQNVYQIIAAAAEADIATVKK
eukprot:1155953-Pelagomonas_calceolata.AAC.4